MKKNFTDLHVDSRSENEKVYMLNKYFRDNQNADQDFWVYGGYEKLIHHFENFNENDLRDLIKDFYYWNSDDLWILAEMFAFIEDYDKNDKLKRINAAEFYCTLFICTNESDSNDLLVNLNYILAKNKNLSEENLHQIELKLITLKKSNNRIQPDDLFEKTLQFIEQIKNSR